MGMIILNVKIVIECKQTFQNRNLPNKGHFQNPGGTGQGRDTPRHPATPRDTTCSAYPEFRAAGVTDPNRWVAEAPKVQIKKSRKPLVKQHFAILGNPVLKTL